MIVRAASLAVLPEMSIIVEAIDRLRIGITLVESSDLLCDSEYARGGFCSSAHGKLPEFEREVFSASLSTGH
jgi:hypothetical protein